MRTLELNKSTLWYANPNGEQVEIIDDNGYHTGEVEIQFNPPIIVKLHIYPASGEVKERTFGTMVDIDMITSTTDVILEENGLLFKEKPIDNYDITYDYKVTKILKSLNSYQYGLKGMK